MLFNDSSDVFVVMSFFFAIDLVVFNVICSLQHVSWMKLGKIVKDSPQTQKKSPIPFKEEL